jgi:hypothetical protein
MDTTLNDPLPTCKVLPTFSFELGIHFYIKNNISTAYISNATLPREKSTNIMQFVVIVMFMSVCNIITAPQNKAKAHALKFYIFWFTYH